MSTRATVATNRTMIAIVALAVVSVGEAILAPPAAAITAQLQGQSSTSTVWIAGNLMGWQELQLIPTRVFFTSGPGSNFAVEVVFDHSKSTGSSFFPGIQDLS